MERVERHREEVEMRMKPASMACASIGGVGVILTPQPVVIGVVCHASQEVVDVTTLGRWVDSTTLLTRVLNRDDVFLLEYPTLMADLEERYPWAATSLGRLPFVPVTEHGGETAHSRLLRLAAVPRNNAVLE